jgi:colanic acid/amylovoran biosynthesis glycosyltransferase
MAEAGRETSLKIVPVLTAGRTEDGRVVLPRKFVDGLVEFRRFWRGPMAAYMTPGPVSTGNLDDCPFLPSELPCEIVILPHTDLAKALTEDANSVALLSLDDFRQDHLSEVCRERGIPCAYVTEYTLLTRKQIIDATTPNPLRRIRRKFWEYQEEGRRKKAVLASAGLQSNGTPTYDAYRELSSDALLYFDNRVTGAMLASEDEVRRKATVDRKSQPIQLLFSGRLARMKGAMQLVDVAKALRTLQVDFHLAICGGGELKDELAGAIRREELSKLVSLAGTLDFATELVPLVKRSVDLFVCCHPQGDPSCTYLETMSCGVPIVGYANEAFEGVVRFSKAGWLVPLNQPEALAAEVARIQKQPGELLDVSLRALGFAGEHTFERTFEKRAEHLQALRYQR